MVSEASTEIDAGCITNRWGTKCRNRVDKFYLRRRQAYLHSCSAQK